MVSHTRVSHGNCLQRQPIEKQKPGSPTGGQVNPHWEGLVHKKTTFLCWMLSRSADRLKKNEHGSFPHVHYGKTAYIYI